MILARKTSSESKCCSKGNQLIRNEISIKLAKVRKISENTLLPGSYLEGAHFHFRSNSPVLQHFNVIRRLTQRYNNAHGPVSSSGEKQPGINLIQSGQPGVC